LIETVRVGDLTALRAMPERATGDPVLFVHGYFADATVFSAWIRHFAARGIPAYAVNLRGRGGSRPETDLGRASVDDFVEDASIIARHLGKPAVVGHSMGGLIAQRLAERGDVRAAVLLTPAPPRGITILSPRLVIKQLKYLRAILTSRLVHPDREDLRDVVFNRTPAVDQEAWLDRMIPDSGRAARDMSITGVPVDAARVRCPILAFTADDDRFVPKRIVERIAARYGAPLRVMSGHAHMLPIEPGWQVVADAVAEWLESR
jgi:pimeloyl-ACP methyl ester carboxylesterase